MGLSECRWNGAGEDVLPDGEKFLYSARAQNDGFLFSKKATKAVMEWIPVGERLIWCRFRTRARSVTIFQTYAPTELAERE